MKSSTLKRMANACVTPLLLLTLAPASMQAAADTLTPSGSNQTASSPQANPDSRNPLAVIAQAQHTDPAGLEQKVLTLQTSPALMALFAGAPTGDTQTYLQFFAAISTPQQVDDFVTRTHGKHFVVDPTQPPINGQPNLAAISLVDGPAMQPQNCCHCWQAWVAAGAYFVASGMLCTPAWALGAVTGWICDGVFWAVGQLPDFDNACR